MFRHYVWTFWNDLEADGTYNMPRMFLEIRFKPPWKLIQQYYFRGVGIYKIDSF